jgi:hypothetical protein
MDARNQTLVACCRFGCVASLNSWGRVTALGAGLDSRDSQRLEVRQEKGTRPAILAIDRHEMSESKDAGGLIRRIDHDCPSTPSIFVARVLDPNAIAIAEMHLLSALSLLGAPSGATESLLEPCETRASSSISLRFPLDLSRMHFRHQR